MPKSNFILINVGFNRFVGNNDSFPICKYIGDNNFDAICGPAIKYKSLYIVCPFALIAVTICFGYFAKLHFQSNGAAWLLLLPASALVIFVVWAWSTRRGPTDGELAANSPAEYRSQLSDLIEFKDRIRSKKVTLYVTRTTFSSGDDVKIAKRQDRVSDDHGLLWIFGKERGKAWPKAIIPQFFEGELLVDAAAVSSHLPKMVEEALRRAALMPASVPKMKPVELGRLEQAMKIAGTWTDKIGAVMKLLHENAALRPGLTIERATEILLMESATPIGREGTRKVLGGRYDPLVSAIRKTAQTFEIQGVPKDTSRDPDNQSG
jgi:hypothetical protein